MVLATSPVFEHKGIYKEHYYDYVKLPCGQHQQQLKTEMRS